MAILVIIMSSCTDATPTASTDRTPAANEADTPAEELGRDFVGAYGTFDANRAISYLADDAEISALITSVGAQGVSGTQQEFRFLISYLEAAHYQQVHDRCQEQRSSASGTDVRCTFDFDLLGSDQMGRGPFRGSYFDLTVRDGEIVRASQSFETAEFSPRMWEPFAAWVSSTFPEDAAVMYPDETYSGVRLTEESVRLWEQRVRDYVREIVAAYGPGRVDGPSEGTHTRTVEGVSFSFDVPTGGWEQFGTISINKSTVGPQGAEAMIFWTGFPDGGDAGAAPCGALLRGDVYPTAASVAAAVSIASGTELVAGPSDVTVGGLPAKHVVVTVREDLGCDPGYFYTWQDVWWGALWPETRAGDTIQVWIVDVGGTLLFIEAETNPDASPTLVNEVEQIIGSIRFD